MKKILLLLLLFIFFIPSLIYFFSPEIDLYHPNEIIFKDDNDDIFYSSINNRYGKYVTFDNIPSSLIDYLLTIEDKDFYNHNGFDVLRIISSSFNNLNSKNSTQGASTITMQLARMIYLNNEKTLKRKIQELFIAIKLEEKLSKNQILEYYLNNIYFAHGIYGIFNASAYYFNKSLIDLNIYEQAMLIGIINAPNLYSPYINLEASMKKTKSVLKTLYKNKKITIDEYYSAIFYKPYFEPKTNDTYYIYPYYLDAIKEELSKMNFSNDNLKKGLVINTYLNTRIQNYLETLVKQINFENSDIAICVMEVNSGKVLGLIGGKDYQTSNFNRALHAKKQIGSTIKPLIYYLALNHGLTPISEFTSKKTTFKLSEEKFYEVSNVNDIYANRKITMIEALAMSDNIYAMKTLLLLGVNRLINLLNTFNCSVDVDNETIALGSNTLTPLELTSIYNAIASNGVFYTPKFIKNIILEPGQTMYTNKSLGKRVMLSNNATIMQYLLRAPFDSALKSYGTPSLMNYYISPSYAGKTGSTNSSSWVIGFSPLYTIGVYIGTDDNSQLNNAYLSRKIFYDVALFLDDKKGTFFKIPDNLKKINMINTLTNKKSFTYVI